MENSNSITKNYRIVKFLAWFTILYNFIEGILSTYFGYEEEGLALFGFGIDSFIELISSLGILFMINRIEAKPQSSSSAAEKTALKITGYCLYSLAILLVFTACLSIYQKHVPKNTVAGVVIAIVSIVVMYILILKKIKIGKALQSEAIISDANCAKVCMYMSMVLLGSSLLNYLFPLPQIDAFGAVGIAYFSFKEGKEALGKAAGTHSCEGHCH